MQLTWSQACQISNPSCCSCCHSPSLSSCRFLILCEHTCHCLWSCWSWRWWWMYWWWFKWYQLTWCICHECLEEPPPEDWFRWWTSENIYSLLILVFSSHNFLFELFCRKTFLQLETAVNYDGYFWIRYQAWVSKNIFCNCTKLFLHSHWIVNTIFKILVECVCNKQLIFVDNAKCMDLLDWSHKKSFVESKF